MHEIKSLKASKKSKESISKCGESSFKIGAKVEADRATSLVRAIIKKLKKSGVRGFEEIDKHLKSKMTDSLIFHLLAHDQCREFLTLEEEVETILSNCKQGKNDKLFQYELDVGAFYLYSKLEDFSFRVKNVGLVDLRIRKDGNSISTETRNLFCEGTFGSSDKKRANFPTRETTPPVTK